jgi:HlyD family secretion protein
VSDQLRALGAQEGAASRQAGRLESLPDDVAAAQRDQARAAADALAAQVDAVGDQRAAATRQAQAAQRQADAASAQSRAAAQTITAGEAAIQRARVTAEECRVRAPRGGYVQLLPWEPGELVPPGVTLATINDISVVTAAFYLPNADLAAAAPNASATVRADAWPDRTFHGVIATVASEAEFTPRNIQTRTDRDRLVYKVEVRLENPDGALRPGMPVEVRLQPAGPE